MDNLQGNNVIVEKKGDSLVTSVPAGYSEPKLQQ